MTSHARMYEQLEWELLLGRQLGNLSGDDEERILERMDHHWWRMSQEEREDAERRLSEAGNIQGAGLFDLVDIEVPLDAKYAPRRAS